MKQAWISLFTLGWIDILNPVAVSMVMVLLPMVRRRWHALIFVYGSCAAYAVCSAGLYFGIDRVLLKLWRVLSTLYPMYAGAALTLVGVSSLAGLVLTVLSMIRAARAHRGLDFEKVLFIKSVAPWFLVLLSFGTTISCMFSAFAMIAYIGILVANRIDANMAVVFIALFSLFSLIPGLGTYLLATRMRSERFTRILDKVRAFMNAFCLYSIPVVLAALAGWTLVAGIGYLSP